LALLAAVPLYVQAEDAPAAEAAAEEPNPEVAVADAPARAVRAVRQEKRKDKSSSTRHASCRKNSVNSEPCSTQRVRVQIQR